MHRLFKSDQPTLPAEAVLFWGTNIFDGTRGSRADDIAQPIVDPSLDTIERRMRREDGDALGRAEKEGLLEGVSEGKR